MQQDVGQGLRCRAANLLGLACYRVSFCTAEEGDFFLCFVSWSWEDSFALASLHVYKEERALASLVIKG